MSELLMNLGWRTMLDILLVAGLFYQIIALLKGTRAAQVLIGMLVIFLAYVLSSLLELETLNWIISKFYSSFIFVVIVLFQDDIRRLLTRFGRGPFVSGLDENSGLRVIDEVVNAAKYLSHDRIGALIVFERGIGLDRLYDHAVRVEALVSEQLLICIFQSFSPLHDGAVIVQKNRLSCASAQLPLSKNPTFSKKLGTRHSAAVGIAEETDAVVLVVSEETGHISVAWDGQLQKQGNIDAVRRTLISLLMPQMERRRSRRWLGASVSAIWERVREKLTPQPLPTRAGRPADSRGRSKDRDRERDADQAEALRAAEFENRLASLGDPRQSQNLELKFPRYAKLKSAQADGRKLVLSDLKAGLGSGARGGFGGALGGAFGAALGGAQAEGSGVGAGNGVVIRGRDALGLPHSEDEDAQDALDALLELRASHSSLDVEPDSSHSDESSSGSSRNKAAQALSHLSAEDKFVPPSMPPSPPPRDVSIGGVPLNPPLDDLESRKRDERKEDK